MTDAQVIEIVSEAFQVAATIAAAQEGAEGDVIAVFQPHRYTRTADLAPEFGEPLALADQSIVTDIYSAGEEPMIGVSGRLVAQAVGAAGGACTYVQRLDDVPEFVAGVAKPGDTVLLLGAGDITAAAPAVTMAIEASS